MPDSDLFSRPSTMRRLQADHGQRLARQLDADRRPVGMTLVWNQRAVVTTGPHTFRITVPVEGPLPSQASVDHVVQTMRDLCSGGSPTRDGCAVASVHGRARALSAQRSCLVLFITCVGNSDDPRRDAAQVTGLVRNAARRCR